MRTLVVEQAARQLVIPDGQPPAGISPLSSDNGSDRADRAILNISFQSVERGSELEIVNDRKYTLIFLGPCYEIASFVEAQCKGFFGDDVLADGKRIPCKRVVCHGGDGHINGVGISHPSDRANCVSGATRNSEFPSPCLREGLVAIGYTDDFEAGIAEQRGYVAMCRYPPQADDANVDRLAHGLISAPEGEA